MVVSARLIALTRPLFVHKQVFTSIFSQIAAIPGGAIAIIAADGNLATEAILAFSRVANTLYAGIIAVASAAFVARNLHVAALARLAGGLKTRGHRSVIAAILLAFTGFGAQRIRHMDTFILMHVKAINGAGVAIVATLTRQRDWILDWGDFRCGNFRFRKPPPRAGRHQHQNTQKQEFFIHPHKPINQLRECRTATAK
jgi:O-antigen ligase